MEDRKDTLNTKAQRNEVYSGNKDNKRLKSRHKALRIENFAADNSVFSVKVALAALCIFRSRKNSVSPCLCVQKKLRRGGFFELASDTLTAPLK